MNIKLNYTEIRTAVQDLEKVAYQFGNQEIEEEHLLYALLEQEDSLILKLIEKMEIDKDYFRNSLNQALDARVKVSGGELRFGQYLNKALVSAEDEAKAMGDEYVSVEHIFLAMLKYPNPAMKALMKEYGLTRERFLQALSTVRGNQRGIDGALVEGVEAHDGVSALVVDVLDGLRDTLTQIAALVAVAQLASFESTGRSARRHHRATEAAVLEHDLDLDGRVAAAVEYLATVDIQNIAHVVSLSLGNGLNVWRPTDRAPSVCLRKLAMSHFFALCPKLAEGYI